MKVNKSEALVTPKKIRKMYRDAVKESLEEGVAKEARKNLRIHKVVIAFLVIYGLGVTLCGIVGMAILAKKAGL